MNTRQDLQKYQSDLTLAFYQTRSFLPGETPLEAIATEIREMIQSYLEDAQVFHTRSDLVNEFASLAYAHGWLDAAIFLGYIVGLAPELFLPEDTEIPGILHDRLQEKSTRYSRMLQDAIDSIEIAPEPGSPLFKAAEFVLKKAEESYFRTNSHHPAAYAKELGWLSYGYGWLDAGLRAGLYRITANPHLFTTETRMRE